VVTSKRFLNHRPRCCRWYSLEWRWFLEVNHPSHGLGFLVHLSMVFYISPSSSLVSLAMKPPPISSAATHNLHRIATARLSSFHQNPRPAPTCFASSLCLFTTVSPPRIASYHKSLECMDRLKRSAEARKGCD